MYKSFLNKLSCKTNSSLRPVISLFKNKDNGYLMMILIVPDQRERFILRSSKHYFRNGRTTVQIAADF